MIRLPWPHHTSQGAPRAPRPTVVMLPLVAIGTAAAISCGAHYTGLGSDVALSKAGKMPALPGQSAHEMKLFTLNRYGRSHYVAYPVPARIICRPAVAVLCCTGVPVPAGLSRRRTGARSAGTAVDSRFPLPRGEGQGEGRSALEAPLTPSL